MIVPRTKGLLNKFEALPAEVKDYFTHFPKIIETFPPEVAIAYMFLRAELAQNMTIYCGVVKLHRVHKDLARSAVETHHMTRQRFRDLYKTVFGEELPKDLVGLISEAETVRDRILHGKQEEPRRQRKALIDIFQYAEQLNNHTYQLAGFRPFGSLQGFKGRADSLDKSTSRWVLMGMGLFERPK